MTDLSLLNETEFEQEIRYQGWVRKLQQPRNIHITEALQIFKDSIYEVCITKMANNEQYEHFRDLLWQHKKNSQNTLDVPRAKSYSILAAAERLGLDVRQNKCRSIFSADKTASMHFYTKNNRFYDFSTNKSGDVLDLVQAVLKCDFVTAVKFVT